MPRRAHQHRLSTHYGIGNSPASVRNIPNDPAEFPGLYDEAYGPQPVSRPISHFLIRRAVDEWNDPVLDAVILKIDALAQVEASTKRIRGGVWARSSYRSNALDGFEHWLDIDQVAQRCGVRVETVRRWRDRGTGPVSSRFGRLVRWEPGSVEKHAKRLDRLREQGRYKPRPTVPQADHYLIATKAGTTWWTGQRWTPLQANAHRYRQRTLATAVAAGLGGVVVPDSDPAVTEQP